MKNIIPKLLTGAGCALLLSTLASEKTLAAEQVNVKIAPYYTEIDYISVYNPGVQYPLIVYKDITYFPMTYGLCTRLGLASGYTPTDGLYISQYDTLWYSDDPNVFGGDAQNNYGTEYTAVIPEYPVYLNGAEINNSTEKYPLLNFRDITYFPMTYKFAVEELGFRIDWSYENQTFKLYRDGNDKKAYRAQDDSDGDVNIAVHTTYSKEIGKNENGDTVYTNGYIYDIYKLKISENGETVSKIRTADKFESSMEYEYGKKYPDSSENVILEDKYLKYKGKVLLDLTQVEKETVSFFAREYEYKNVTFIYLNLSMNNAPAPYTNHGEYIFAFENGNIKQLTEWDTRNNLTDIFEDGLGGYYICSGYFSPMHSSRWSTSFATVYHYTVDGKFKELAIDDINSVSAIGTYNGKLYVKAMYYAADKEAFIEAPPISTVNSGYYEIDTASGTVRKLYPFVQGNVFVAPNGTPYCLVSSKTPKIINLLTKNILNLE